MTAMHKCNNYIHVRPRHEAANSLCSSTINFKHDLYSPLNITHSKSHIDVLKLHVSIVGIDFNIKYPQQSNTMIIIERYMHKNSSEQCYSRAYVL